MTWLYFVFMYILPFALLAVFNLLIYKEIRRATKKRTSLTRCFLFLLQSKLFPF